MTLLLQNQVAIITGAGSGMGKAMALSFANEGAIVAACDINVKAAEETAWLIQEGNGEAFALGVDVSDARSVKQLIESVIEREGRVDIVVNCAGLPQAFTAIEDLTEEEWDRTLNVNTKSVFLTAKYAVPHMKKQNQGVILNISSIASERPRPGLNAYCASKGAVVTLTKALALELAPFGIRVNAINPGPTDTAMLGKFIPDRDGKTPQQKRDLFLSGIPLGKLIEPEDIAQSALYLCSPLAQKVTGTILNVDGGRGV
jgi:3-oxoacyl-[acyl-carrier protein] reductase